MEPADSNEGGGSDPERAASEAEAKRDLLGLLKSKDLSPEEHKKILAIATSIGPHAGAARADESRNHVRKALFILAALLAAALLAGTWYQLVRIERAIKKQDAGYRSIPGAPHEPSSGDNAPRVPSSPPRRGDP